MWRLNCPCPSPPEPNFYESDDSLHSSRVRAPCLTTFDGHLGHRHQERGTVFQLQCRLHMKMLEIKLLRPVCSNVLQKMCQISNQISQGVMEGWTLFQMMLWLFENILKFVERFLFLASMTVEGFFSNTKQ